MVGQYSNTQDVTTFTFDNLSNAFIGFYGMEDSTSAVAIGVIEIDPLCTYSESEVVDSESSGSGGWLIAGIIIFIVIGVTLFVFWYWFNNKQKEKSKI